MNTAWNSFRVFFWMVLLTGVIYPLIITLIAQITMNHQANGSLIVSDGKVVGSELIAQKFQSDHYFWPRPSAVDYNPLPSGGSNFGPTSSALKKAVEARKDNIAKSQNSNGLIPGELLFASASGLDPHISPETAYFQLNRVAHARNLDSEKARQKIAELIEKNTQKSFLGENCVNVLMLNVALDKLK